MEKNTKIRVAFIKFGGLSAGGTEKFLQTIAANLHKEKFDVSYFYTDTAPYKGSSYRHADTDAERKKYMESAGVKLIQCAVTAKDITKRTHPWIGTDFFQKFKESDFDIVQTGRAGHPEFPFNYIRNVPIVDSIHLLAGIDNQYNISRVLHITQWSADRWIKAGGDPNRVKIVSHPMEIQSSGAHSLATELHLGEKFVYGFHQRNDDAIFSPIPLEAYKRIEASHNHFIIMGGGEAYKKQASDLHIKNITFLPHSANPQDIYSFLMTLSVYAHGRKDGEVNSTAMAEALFFGLPIVSHRSPIHNGHIECIGNAGTVVATVLEYATEMNKLATDMKYYAERKARAFDRFKEMYELTHQMKHIEHIYEEVVKNPFPHHFSRIWYSLRLRYYFVYGPKKILRLLGI